jgi:hypothetical protein
MESGFHPGYLLVPLLVAGLALTITTYYAIDSSERYNTLKYCPDESYDYSPVYNKTINQAVYYPVASRCCKDVKEEVLEGDSFVYKDWEQCMILYNREAEE